jgi:hypothetical protein
MSLSDTANSALEKLAEVGILGKTKAEIAARIVTDWIWQNEDRLFRQGIPLSRQSRKKIRKPLDAVR